MSQKLYREGKDYTQEDLKGIRAMLKKTAPLKTFTFEVLGPGEQWVSISSPEFTAICPFSDFPDFGTVTIRYIPDRKCLELKSFKLYINAFRNVKIFHEAVTEVIFADFLESVKPKKAHIIVDMNVRGNVKTICEKKFRC
ncbi:MAG: preQ(1) synthase [Patescibacteria group bacterium]